MVSLLANQLNVLCILCFVYGGRFPFLLSDFFEGKIYAEDIAFDDFELPIMGDNMSGDVEGGSNQDNDDEDGEESYSSLHMHSLYDSWLVTTSLGVVVLVG